MSDDKTALRDAIQDQIPDGQMLGDFVVLFASSTLDGNEINTHYGWVPGPQQPSYRSLGLLGIVGAVAEEGIIDGVTGADGYDPDDD